MIKPTTDLFVDFMLSLLYPDLDNDHHSQVKNGLKRTNLRF
jgi:hypothetical protein